MTDQKAAVAAARADEDLFVPALVADWAPKVCAAAGIGAR